MQDINQNYFPYTRDVREAKVIYVINSIPSADRRISALSSAPLSYAMPLPHSHIDTILNDPLLQPSAPPKVNPNSNPDAVLNSYSNIISCNHSCNSYAPPMYHASTVRHDVNNNYIHGGAIDNLPFETAAFVSKSNLNRYPTQHSIAPTPMSPPSLRDSTSKTVVIQGTEVNQQYKQYLPGNFIASKIIPVNKAGSAKPRSFNNTNNNTHQSYKGKKNFYDDGWADFFTSICWCCSMISILPLCCIFNGGDH